MKKQFIIAAVLLMGLIGCQKDVTLDTQSAITSAETATKTKSLFDSEPATYKADVMQKIKAFEARLEKIEDGTLPKNDASMAVEAVIWNVEALMNLNYGKAQLSFNELQSEKAVIEVPLDANGNVANDALLAAVQTLRANTKNMA